MRKCLILLPTRYNDGAPVESWKMETALDRLDGLIGGHTIDGNCEGVYKMDDGTMARDTCVKVVAVCDDAKLPELREFAQLCAVSFGQESIYLEHTPATVEFIRPAA
jgi:hypothetical protein